MFYPKVAFKLEKDLAQRKEAKRIMSEVMSDTVEQKCQFQAGFYCYLNDRGIACLSKAKSSGFTVLSVKMFNRYSDMFNHKHFLANRESNIAEIRNTLRHGLKNAKSDTDKVLRITFHALLIGLRQFDKI